MLSHNVLGKFGLFRATMLFGKYKRVQAWINNALLTLENEFESVEFLTSTPVTRVLIKFMKFCNMIIKG